MEILFHISLIHKTLQHHRRRRRFTIQSDAILIEVWTLKKRSKRNLNEWILFLWVLIEIPLQGHYPVTQFI